MKDLLTYILSGILGETDFVINETETEGQVELEIKAKKESMGLIIGKGGNTIKAIQTLLRVRGRIDNKLVHVSVSESE
jgi:uncharacterized protein